MDALKTFLAITILSALVSGFGGILIQRSVIRAARASAHALRGRTRWLTLVVGLFGAGLFALSILATGGPVLGLGGLVIGPPALRRAAQIFSGRRSRELDRSAIVFLHALRGLIRAGLSLPYALFHLARVVPSAFSDSLDLRLRDFESGKSLQVCLSRFRARTGMRLTAIGLQILELAYRDGLALLPFLDRMLPLLEAEDAARQRVCSLQKTVLAQAATAALLPWALAVVLYLVQPDVLLRFRAWPYFFPGMGVVFAWEILGLCLIRRAACFY